MKETEQPESHKPQRFDGDQYLTNLAERARENGNEVPAWVDQYLELRSEGKFDEAASLLEEYYVEDEDKSPGPQAPEQPPLF